MDRFVPVQPIQKRAAGGPDEQGHDGGVV